MIDDVESAVCPACVAGERHAHRTWRIGRRGARARGATALNGPGPTRTTLGDALVAAALALLNVLTWSVLALLVAP